MKHLGEHSVGLYVLKRTIFDHATRAFMEDHLKTCTACAEVERELGVYHTELSDMLRTASNRVRIFAETVSQPPNAVRLYPYRHLPDSTLVDTRYVTVLAAHSLESYPYRFKPIAIYSSIDQQIIVRILRDTEGGLYKLYVLGARQETSRFAVVSFPELQMDLSTDESGKKDFSLPSDKHPSDWHGLNVFVRLRGQ